MHFQDWHILLRSSPLNNVLFVDQNVCVWGGGGFNALRTCPPIIGLFTPFLKLRFSHQNQHVVVCTCSLRRPSIAPPLPGNFAPAPNLLAILNTFCPIIFLVNYFIEMRCIDVENILSWIFYWNEKHWCWKYSFLNIFPIKYSFYWQWGLLILNHV